MKIFLLVMYVICLVINLYEFFQGNIVESNHYLLYSIIFLLIIIGIEVNEY